MNRFLLLLLLIPAFCRGNTDTFGIERRFIDSAHVNLQHYSEKSVEEYRNNADFEYAVEAPGRGFMERLMEWILRIFTDNINEEKINTSARILEWSIGLIGLFLLIRFLVRSERIALLKRAEAEGAALQFHDFDGSEDELDKLLTEAEQQQNYPLALRYLFIKTLFLLRDSGSIRWKPEKTNREYLRELKSLGIQGPFEKLVKLFEFGIYGKYTIAEADYKEAQALLDKVRTGLKGGQHV